MMGLIGVTGGRAHAWGFRSWNVQNRTYACAQISGSDVEVRSETTQISFCNLIPRSPTLQRIEPAVQFTPGSLGFCGRVVRRQT